MTKPTRLFSFDSSCFDLAEHFLQDECDFLIQLTEEQRENIANALAQDIQDSVESWFGYDLVNIKEEYDDGKTT